MATVIKRITGLPTKEDANDVVTIWKHTPSFVKGSDKVYPDAGTGTGWTAESKFQVAAEANVTSDTNHADTDLAWDKLAIQPTVKKKKTKKKPK